MKEDSGFRLLIAKAASKTALVLAVGLSLGGCAEEGVESVLAPGDADDVFEDREQRVYILVDRTCGNGQAYAYARFASAEAMEY